MVGQQMPFQFTVLSSSDSHTFKDGQIISTFNKCGFFFCRRGNVEVSLEDKLFQIKPGDVYIYMASTLVHLLHKSGDCLLYTSLGVLLHFGGNTSLPKFDQ